MGSLVLLDLMGGDVAMPAALAPYTEAVFRQAGGPFDLRLYVGGAGPAALLSTTGAFEDLRLAEQSYAQGGELRLHGFPNPFGGSATVPFVDVMPETDCLVAFPSWLTHEVRPVRVPCRRRLRPIPAAPRWTAADRRA